MVSEIKNYLHRKAQETKKLSTGLSPKRPQPRWIRMLEYPPTGQAGARCDGICQEPESGSALKPSGTGGKTGENLSGARNVENLWIMWVSTWIIC